jgi:hypothetical protein
MRILVIDGHPDAGSYGDAVARAYVNGAESGGHDVRVFRLREMQFDPILHGGFKKPQPLEPDLVKARDAIWDGPWRREPPPRSADQAVSLGSTDGLRVSRSEGRSSIARVTNRVDERTSMNTEEDAPK